MTDQKKLEVIEKAFIYYHDRTSLTRLEEKELTDFVDELKEAISVTRCCESDSEQLCDEGNLGKIKKLYTTIKFQSIGGEWIEYKTE